MPSNHCHNCTVTMVFSFLQCLLVHVHVVYKYSPILVLPYLAMHSSHNNLCEYFYIPSQVNRGSAGSPRWQYAISSTQGRLMLNTDICLVKNINPLASGRVRRDLDLITDNTDIKTVVEDYATNNINWLNRFGEVTSSIHI